MAKKTYLYKAEMKNGEESLKTTYFYARSKRLVDEFCRENYFPLTHYQQNEITKVGECKYTVNEPVVEFNDDEKAQIEKYFLREMMKYVYVQQQIEAGNY